MENYSNKKDQKKEFKGNKPKQDSKKPYVMTKMEAKLFAGNKNEKGFEYDRIALKELLESIPFNKISITVYAMKDAFSPGLTGIRPVGYFNFYDVETETFNMTTFSQTDEVVQAFDNPIIFPRLYVNKESSSDIGIIALIISPAETFSELV